MVFDQAQSPRLGQKAPIESTYVRIFTGTDIPEAAWHGQMIYRSDLQVLQIFNSQRLPTPGWEDVVSGDLGTLTYVGPNIPVAGSVGDIWLDTDDNYKMYVARSIGANEIIAGEWELAQDSTSAYNLASQANTTAGNAYTLAGQAHTEATPDGIAPTTAPAATIDSGLGYITVRWTPISNRDPVTYYVHLGTSSDFVPDYSQNSTTLQGTTFGSTFSIARLKDGTDLDISGATTYYAKIIPWDADGFGPVGAVGSGKPSRVTTTYIEPFTIQADNVADFVLAATKFNTSTHMIF